MTNKYVNQYESIFTNHDILSNPFMEFTKAELQEAYENLQGQYERAAIGSAPRRQAFNGIACIEVAFDAYARSIKLFDVYVDEDTTLRDVLEDSYEISNGTAKTIEELRRDVGLPSVIQVGSELIGGAVKTTKKAGDKFVDGLFTVSNWLSKKTDPSKRK